MDGWKDMTMLLGAFRNFTNVPKNLGTYSKNINIVGIYPVHFSTI